MIHVGLERIQNQIPSLTLNAKLNVKRLPAMQDTWVRSLCNSGKELASQCRQHKRRGFNPWVGKIPWRRAQQPTSVFLPGESQGQRSLAGYSPWGHKKSDTTEQLTLSFFTFQLLEFRAFTTVVPGSIPGRRTKILYKP